MLSSIKLTISQWALAIGAGIIGILVLALRLQGKRLHQTQVELLATKLDNEMDARNERVKQAKVKFKKALDAYRGEGK